MMRAIVIGALCAVLSIPAAADAQDTAGTGTVSGTVLNAGGTPELAVTVCLVGTTRCALTDERGHFKLGDVRPGNYQVELTPAGGSRITSDRVEVRAGFDTAITLALPVLGVVKETVTVTASAFVPVEEVKTSAFLIQRDEIRSSAGALQDVSRYLQALPGVGFGASDFRNDLIVRGGSPLENLFVVDNVEIPNINAFANFSSAGGTVSLIDSALIQDVTFLTGGYPASYGNRVSSVLQVTQREGDRERFRGRATVGFAGAGTVLEGPIAGGKGSWVVSWRRSFLDLFSNDVGVGGVPVLNTLNGKAVLDLTPRDRLWAVSVSGRDRIRLGLTEDTDPLEPLADFDIQYRGWRSANGVNWQRLLGRGVSLLGVTHSIASVDAQVKDLLRDGVPPAGTPADEAIAAGPVVFREGSREAETTVKYDLTTYVPVAGKIQVGGAAKLFQLQYDTAAPLGSGSPFAYEEGVNAFDLQRVFRTHQLGAYAQATTDFTSRISLTWGARFDRFAYLDESRIGPRVGLSVRLSQRATWRASAGRYYQQPPFLFLAAFPENAQLDPLRADHLVTGVSFELSESARISVEAYRKQYRDYPVSTTFPALSLANVGDTFNTREVLFPMSSEGRGESTGLELLFEKKPGGRWYGQANVSLARARHAGQDGVMRPGSYDSPIIVNVDGGVRGPAQLLLTARMAWLSGRPYTAYDQAASIAAGRGLFDLTNVNGSRAPDYFRLDLRAERSLRVRGGEVVLFGGVQNVTNRRNFAGYYWSRRTATIQFQQQTGIFPIAGLDWRF